MSFKFASGVRVQMTTDSGLHSMFAQIRRAT